MAEAGQNSSPEPTSQTSELQKATGHDVKVSFSRPGLTVYLNLLATLLFAVTGMLYLLSGRTWFGVGWWIIAAVWLRRYFWARGMPLLEIDGQNILVHVGPYRVRPLPLAEVISIQLDQGKILLKLEDGSEVKFSSFDLQVTDMERFVACVERRKGQTAPSPSGPEDEG